VAILLVAKMHGAGNDFVVVPDAPPASGRDAVLVRALADRRRGVGADGVLFLERCDEPGIAFRMHFYNCDGGRAGLCLNGARCAALRSVQLGWSGPELSLLTEYTTVQAKVDGDRVRLSLPLPHREVREVDLPEGSPATRGWAVHTGDPHLVLELDDVEADSFEARARPLRWWTGPDPAGSNVHFVDRTGEDWQIRSFERGIEGETLACGSGCVSALLAFRGAEPGSRAALRTRTGAVIEVCVDGPNLVLEGPAVCVFTTDWFRDGSE
jgi:diaminopimelate epimerase